jgi:hypothetical protein
MSLRALKKMMTNGILSTAIPWLPKQLCGKSQKSVATIPAHAEAAGSSKNAAALRAEFLQNVRTI